MFDMLKLKSPLRKCLKHQTPQVTRFTVQDRVRECESVIEQTSHLKYKHICSFGDGNYSAQLLNGSSGLCLLYDCGSIWFPITLFTQDVKNFQIILTPASEEDFTVMKKGFEYNKNYVKFNANTFPVSSPSF